MAEHMPDHDLEHPSPGSVDLGGGGTRAPSSPALECWSAGVLERWSQVGEASAPDGLIGWRRPGSFHAAEQQPRIDRNVHVNATRLAEAV